MVQEIARFGLPYLDVPADEQPMQRQHVPLALRSLIRTEELTAEGLTLEVDVEEGSFTVAIAPDGPAGARLAPGQRIAVTERNLYGPLPDADVTVRSSLPVLLWVRRGELSSDDAETQGLLEFSGPAGYATAARRLLSTQPGSVAAA